MNAEEFALLVNNQKVIFNAIREMGERIDEVKINEGRILSRMNENRSATELQGYEFKVFSQWGEDGIIQHLIKNIEIPKKTFIEFGVEDFSESNCRFLMMKDNWKGFVIDGSKENIDRLRNSYYFWRHDLQAVDAFITRENINDLLARSGFDSDVGILSIDIDGNDYHVLQAITYFRPRILICEYNAVLGPTRKIAVPYDPAFQRLAKHHSGLYYGASLAAFTFLAESRGYSLVGVNGAGINAFFVRKDLLSEHLTPVTVEVGYRSSMHRDTRDENGRLTFIATHERLKVIAGLPVINVETQTSEFI